MASKAMSGNGSNTTILKVYAGQPNISFFYVNEIASRVPGASDEYSIATPAAQILRALRISRGIINNDV